MPSRQHSRQYDLVVFGATGYTGKLTAEHISTHLPTDLNWAVAGRSLDKLEQVVAKCKLLNPDRRQPGKLERKGNGPTVLTPTPFVTWKSALLSRIYKTNHMKPPIKMEQTSKSVASMRMNWPLSPRRPLSSSPRSAPMGSTGSTPSRRVPRTAPIISTSPARFHMSRG